MIGFIFFFNILTALQKDKKVTMFSLNVLKNAHEAEVIQNEIKILIVCIKRNLMTDVYEF